MPLLSDFELIQRIFNFKLACTEETPEDKSLIVAAIKP
jgi:hypothetical protein